MRPAAVRTFLTVPGGRSFTDRPRADLGLVRFGGWQIHPVDSSAYGEDAYLIRAGIDVVTDPGAPRPDRVDAGFDLGTPGAAVLDALPHAVHRAEPARVYQLGPTLNFVPVTHGEAAGRPVPLGAQEPTTVAFGLTSAEFWWRWSSTGGLADGHRAGWLVLLVPAGVRELEVRPWATFTPPPRPGWRPACDPVDRLVPLPEPTNQPSRAGFGGPAALEFTRRLADSWSDLTILLAVPAHHVARFDPARRAHDLWRWLEVRDELSELPEALDAIDRPDLAALLRDLS